MENWILIVFVAGYAAIAFEHGIRLNKAASALITGVLCWVLYITGGSGEAFTESVNETLMHQTGEIASILFFLLGAMTIVELIDAHDGFNVVSAAIRTRKKSTVLWILTFVAFFLSAVLDNLTTTIVMISLVRKLVNEREERLLFVGLVVIAANAGGAWSPIGDVTTTMLWIKGQITTWGIMKTLFIPSLVCLLIPVFLASFRFKGEFSEMKSEGENTTTTSRERNIIFFSGISILILIPVFKTLTHLPPFMGMMMGLGILWVISEFLHYQKDEEDKSQYSVVSALRKIDTPSVLFFLGILLAVGSLTAVGTLPNLAHWLDKTVGDIRIIAVMIGLLSAIVDNVPLVAAAMEMYPLSQFPADHDFWNMLAYCAGTGGSCLIIGSAAGVAAMGLEQISFFWYLKKVSLLALLGYLGGVGVHILLTMV